MIGFTVMQHAFAGGALNQGLFSDVERQALALTGSGDTVCDLGRALACESGNRLTAQISQPSSMAWGEWPACLTAARKTARRGLLTR